MDNTWLGSLALQFAHDGTRTYLAKKEHQGPLVIQKTLHPEGPELCHGIIIHPPGGVAGGDHLLLQVELAENARTLLTTPGAGKWYKANEKTASQIVKITLKQAAQLEWFPQENILFDGAHVHFTTNVTLEADARYAGWDIVCFGRIASGEKWTKGEFRQNTEIRRQGKLLWKDTALLTPDSRVMQSLSGLRGGPVCANFIVAAPSIPIEILEKCRAIDVPPPSLCGVTALPDIFSARYIGNSTQEARHYFEKLWEVLRPWYGQKDMVRPRIWNT